MAGLQELLQPRPAPCGGTGAHRLLRRKKPWFLALPQQEVGEAGQAEEAPGAQRAALHGLAGRAAHRDIQLIITDSLHPGDGQERSIVQVLVPGPDCNPVPAARLQAARSLRGSAAPPSCTAKALLWNPHHRRQWLEIRDNKRLLPCREHLPPTVIYGSLRFDGCNFCSILPSLWVRIQHVRV